MDDLSSLIDSFIIESKEHLRTMQDLFLLMEKQPENHDTELINSIFRAAHTIKGSSGFFGFQNISDLTHSMETLLSLIRRGEMQPSTRIVDALLFGLDTLNTLLDDTANSDRLDISETIKIFNSIISKDLESDLKNETDIISILTDIEKKVSFSFREVTLKNIPEFHDFLYVLKFDLTSFERDNGLNPLELMKNLNVTGEIIDGLLEVPEGTLDDGVPKGKLIYRLLYSTVADPEVIDGLVDLPSDNIFQIDKKELMDILGGITNHQDTVQEKVLITPSMNGIIIEETNLHNESNKIEELQISQDRAKNDETHPEPSLGIIKKGQNSQIEEMPLSTEGNKTAETVRIRLDVLDKLMMLAGELVLVRNQQLMHVNKNDPISRTISQRLNIVTTDLQETIMRTRMQPIGSIFGKFSRIVRDLGKKLNKQIEIEMTGNDVELDKTILETLTDPLTHLIRNCCDHGIELPEDRINLHKHPVGRISLNAYHEGGQMNIEIKDDGKGIDIEAVKAKALEKGLKSEDDLLKMNEKEVLSLIFLPGFSTVTFVNEMSGRGVGMDVVKTSIEKLGGIIEIQTKKGTGTQILLRLPLTLAILPSLILVSGGNRYAIPQVNLEEIVCLYDQQVYEKIECAGNEEVYRLRNFLLPIVHLNEVLSRPKPFTDTDKAEITEFHRNDREIRNDNLIKSNSGSISQTFVVLKAGNRRFGLVIDNVIGTEEIVVKPMHRALNGLSIYSGATVLGDGRVALIIDAQGIATHAGIEINKQEDKAEKISEESNNSDKKCIYEILLFSLGSNEQFSMNLNDIKRIEKIRTDKIERVGETEFINIDGHSMPIIRLTDNLRISGGEDKEEMFLLMPKKVKKPCGILISKLIDIGNYELNIDTESCVQDGITGSAIIKDRMTLLLDSERLIEKAFTKIHNIN
jgi:two-component system chemotaxis sensor kinase CheA